MTHPRTLPAHLKRLAPKREDYPSEEAYEEAKAYFRQRVGRTIPQSRSKAFHSA
jgi:hypothetical protein